MQNPNPPDRSMCEAGYHSELRAVVALVTIPKLNDSAADLNILESFTFSTTDTVRISDLKALKSEPGDVLLHLV